MQNSAVSTSSSNPLPVFKDLSTKEKLNVILHKTKKITIIVIKILVLLALALYQGPVFASGFAIGFIIKCIKKDECTEAIRRIKAAIAERPWLFAGIVIGITIIVPEWLLVGLPLMGGFYAGVKTAKLMQK